MSEHQNFFSSICDDHDEAEKLEKRALKMIALRSKIVSQTWSIEQAASECGVSVAWIGLLLNGHIDLVEDIDAVCARVDVTLCTR